MCRAVGFVSGNALKSQTDLLFLISTRRDKWRTPVLQRKTITLTHMENMCSFSKSYAVCKPRDGLNDCQVDYECSLEVLADEDQSHQISSSWAQLVFTFSR